MPLPHPPNLDWSTQSRPSVIDFFAGAGGLSLGFARAGFRVEMAVDNCAAAVETHRWNLGASARDLDLSAGNLALPSATVIVGGPPCQGFSSAGQRKRGDKRNTLVSRFASLVAQFRPAMFVFENVEGFITAEGGSRVMELLEPLVVAGYRIHLRKVNAANFGVPQHRKRVIAIGALGWDPHFPEPTHTAYGAPGARLGGFHLPPTPTLGEALANLPLASEVGPGEPEDHYRVPLEGRDLERARMLRPGQTMKDLPESYWHDSYRRRAFRRVMDGTPTERRGGAPAGIRRLRLEEPSKAITSMARNEFVHPREDRCLTVRECACLQTFPDRFRFFGSASERMQLIGNAVPPLLASKIADAVLQSLQSATIHAGPGALLSFVPTLSNGMSPALGKVVQEVRSRHPEPTGRRMQLSLWS
ncbi:MAG: DNA cytosine methyltransferase [Synechococcus sp. SB0667_bin_8]|nr:DNA cytosine methyltransferase [Synechococcus sp. SB0667_bin_8]MYG64744.1 DNA cytosine methyltransferase [Synechococcus sp. SB0675_bin_7]MYK85774.1 DNA cytosine methyltransferase [Synechococcus sp. SB0669_bin_7]